MGLRDRLKRPSESSPEADIDPTLVSAGIRRVFEVPDVSCDHCRNSIEEAVSVIEGVTSVAVDLAEKTVVVTGGSEESVSSAIDAAGYPVASVSLVDPS